MKQRRLWLGLTNRNSVVYKISLGNLSMTQVVFGSGLPLMACRFLVVAMKFGNPIISIPEVCVCVCGDPETE